MERLKCVGLAYPDVSNSTNCTATTQLYPTRIVFDHDLLPEIPSKSTTDSATIVLDPQAHFGVDALPTMLNPSGSGSQTNVFSPLASFLLTSTGSGSGNDVNPTMMMTLSTLDSIPAATSTMAIGTTPPLPPLTMTPSTTTSEAINPSTPPSNTSVSGLANPGTGGHHRGVIAGSVIAVLVIVVVGLGIFICYRRRRCSRAGTSPAWKEIEKAENAQTSAICSDRNVKDKGKNHQSRQSCPNHTKSDGQLGEPDPALSTADVYRSISPPNLHTSKEHRYTISNTSSVSDASNPFATPTDSSFDSGDPTCSQIGLALSRYSTRPEKQTLSEPECRFESSQHNLSQLPSLAHSTPLSNASRVDLRSKTDSQIVNHKRASLISADTDGPEIGDEVVFEVASLVEQPTARRYSLTPRIINIVANASRSDDSDLSRSNSRLGSPKVRKSFTRARSASPARVLAKYTGSPDGHSGIEIWGMHSRLTSSELSREQVTDAQTKSSYGGETARRSSTKSSAIQARQVNPTDHTSYPPTSFPHIGRTMSEAKRKIRAQSEQLHDSGNLPGGRFQLPNSVTIERGHRK